MEKLEYGLYRVHFNFFSNFVSLCCKECRLRFFRYVEDVGKINMLTEWEELQGKVLENEKIIVEWEAEKKILGEKVKKLKMKRDILEEAMEDMKNELYQLYGSV